MHLILWISILVLIGPLTSRSLLARESRDPQLPCGQILEPPVREGLAGKWVQMPENRLLADPGQAIKIKKQWSPGMQSPFLEAARRVHLWSDFKNLSDLAERDLSESQKREILTAAAHQAGLRRPYTELPELMSLSKTQLETYLNFLIPLLYHADEVLLPFQSKHDDDAGQRLMQAGGTLKDLAERYDLFGYLKYSWHFLTKVTPPETTGSLIPRHYPEVTPGDRFDEMYYWDTFFVVLGLIEAGNLELAIMQVEIFARDLETYSMIGNGSRDYYLTRSQPPLMTSMVKAVINGAMAQGYPRERLERWLKFRILPLLESDYWQFWMNPETRYNTEWGLNKHWDALNTARPERFGTDPEEELGEDYRAVRARAESGKDFATTPGKDATFVAPVLLNSVLHMVEMDLARFYTWLGHDDHKSRLYLHQAQKRREAMHRNNWNPHTHLMYDFNLRSEKQIPILTADVFFALFAGVIPRGQELELVNAALQGIETPYGVVASEVDSDLTWDINIWPPHQFAAMYSVLKYSHQYPALKPVAQRLTTKWVETVWSFYEQNRQVLERYYGKTGGHPPDAGDFYETQTGFGWTCAVTSLAIKLMCKNGWRSQLTNIPCP